MTANGNAVARRDEMTSAALAIRPGQSAWDEFQLAALAQIGLKDASDGDRAVFLHQCQRTGLDPFARQIYCIGRNEKKNERRGNAWVETWTVKWTIQTGIDGWRVIRARAEKRGGFRAHLGRAVWYDGDGNDYKVWVRADPPAACEITLTVVSADGSETLYTSVLMFREYVQLKNDKPVAQWASKPAHMLEKCTEADVYRKAFPQDFSGIDLDDAMPPPEAAPAGPAVVRVTAEEITSRPARPRREAADPTPAAASPAGPATPQDAPDGAGVLEPSEMIPVGPEHAAALDDDTKPPALATGGQVGILARHFKRLGFDDDEREHRLAITATIAGAGRVASSRELTQSQAMAVQRTIERCKDRDQLIAILASGEAPHE